MDSYVGKRIDGRYEIREIIGVGGMAVVYKAYDNIDDRIVAVKILKEEFLANEEFRRRFKNESKAIAVLSHQNIVKVYDVSFGDKLQYIVMEYVEGITLKEYIQQQGVINCKEVVHFTTQILKALQHAHDKGIVHRDIKPQNILLLQNGTIKVTDFGIARFSRSESRTVTNSAIGSVHYVSPEQARGEITDEKSDIYSIGVMMYEMLTGQLPFQGDSAVSVALMHVQEDAPLPTEINSDIPTGLEEITVRAMFKNPRDRYQTAAEMLLDIESYKKNPSIVFEYNYATDKNETAEASEEDVIDDYEDDYIDEVVEDNVVTDTYTAVDDFEIKSKKSKKNFNFKKYLPVLLGVVAAALVVGLVVLLVVNITGNSKVVDNFVGMNYNNEIQNNEKYEGYNFVVVEKVSEDGTPGEVLFQDPEAGSKYKKNMNITLTVVKSSGDLVVPDVYELSLADAQEKLKNNSLAYTVVLEYSETVKEGYVIRTNPKRHESVQQGDKITLYVSDPNAEKSVVVPDIIGSTVEAAKTELKSLELLLDENYEEVNSSEPAGTIVSCSPAVGEKATIGSKIKVKVSTGNSESASISVDFVLPNDGEGDIVAKLNADVIVNKVGYSFDGSTYTVTATGTGNDDKLTIYVDDMLYFSCSIDFTSGTPVTSSVIDNTDEGVNISTKSAVSSVGGSTSSSTGESSDGGSSTGAPTDYTGYEYGSARWSLEYEGYTVVIEPQLVEDESQGSMVLSQSVNGNTVTLTVGYVEYGLYPQ